MVEYIAVSLGAHTYALAAEGLKMRVRHFYSREDATQAMYRIMAKYGLRLVSVWNDHHCKTYNFMDGVKIHINRDN